MRLMVPSTRLLRDVRGPSLVEQVEDADCPK
jgi:hypothetical protein